MRIKRDPIDKILTNQPLSHDIGTHVPRTGVLCVDKTIARVLLQVYQLQLWTIVPMRMSLV